MKTIVIEISPRESEAPEKLMREAHNTLQSSLKGWFAIKSKVIEVVESETVSH